MGPAISSTAFDGSFSMSCLRIAFRIVAINFGGYVLNNVVCTSGFVQNMTQNFFPVLVNVALQGYHDSPCVCEETRCFTHVLSGF